MANDWSTPGNGIVGGYLGGDKNIQRVMMAFAAIAWYNALEIIFLVLVRFKSYKSLYFWLLITNAFAIIVYTIGSWGKMEDIAENTLITQTFENVGWIVMVAGNSLVLWSRLHLITQNDKLLRGLLWAIVINAVVMYIPTTALDYGCNVHLTDPWCNGYTVVERIQMTCFSILELVISIIYIVEAYRFLKTVYPSDRKRRFLLYELLAVNVALIALDVCLLSVEYEDYYEIEVTLKSLVYSVKLKLEMGILSRLVKVARGRNRSGTFMDDWSVASHDGKKGGDLDRAEHVEEARRSGSSTWLVKARESFKRHPNRSQSHPSATMRRMSSATARNTEFITMPDFDTPRMPPHKRTQRSDSLVHQLPSDALTLQDVEAGAATSTEEIDHSPTSNFTGSTLNGPTPPPPAARMLGDQTLHPSAAHTTTRGVRRQHSSASTSSGISNLYPGRIDAGSL